jgi:hypothetical protein
MSIQIKAGAHKRAGVPKLSAVRPLKVSPGGRTKLTQFELQVVDDTATFAGLQFDIFASADIGKIEVQRRDGFEEANVQSQLFFVIHINKINSSNFPCWIFSRATFIFCTKSASLRA